MKLNLNETTQDLFEQFARNQMNESDLAQFKLKLNQEPEFNEAYQAFLISKDVINEKIEASLRVKMKEWDEKNASQEKIDSTKIIEMPRVNPKVRRMYAIRAVAASILFLTIGYSYIANHGDLDKTINEQFELASISTRSTDQNKNDATIENIVDKLSKTTDKQSINSAIKELQLIQSDADQNNKTTQRLIGILATRLGNEALAENALKKSDADKDLIELSKIFCQLKNKKNTTALQTKLDFLLQDTNGAYYETFQSLKKKTNNPIWKLFN